MDGSLITGVDQGIQRYLMQELNTRWPQFGFIGEEMSHDDQVRVCEHSKRGFWVLDPLDGTTNFTSGFLFFGISLALVIKEHPVLAVTYDPVRDECFTAQKGRGAFINGKPLVCPDTGVLSDCIANIDYKRLVGGLVIATGSMSTLSVSTKSGLFSSRMVLAGSRQNPALSAWRTEALGLRRRLPDFA